MSSYRTSEEAPVGRSMEVTKTYLITNTLETSFPPDFLNSKNKKYIQFRWCRGLWKGKLVGDISLHADFICRDRYMDSMVCYINDDQGKYEKYEYNSTSRKFKVWFKDIKGNPVEPEAFTLKLMLIY